MRDNFAMKEKNMFPMDTIVLDLKSRTHSENLKKLCILYA